MSAIGRSPDRSRATASVFAALLVLGACGSGRGDEPDAASQVTTADGSIVPTTLPPSTVPPAVLPEGFDRGRALVTKADGSTCDICVWRATNGGDRSRGLMEVTDLGPAVGMTFEYGEMRDGWFWMKNTVLPLSIAFFDAGGNLVDALDMEPCTEEPCERYFPDGEYLLAIEVLQGELESLGIADGSRLELLDLPCDE